jgi:RNA polymerase sigma-70 factor (ECF subfamily)
MTHTPKSLLERLRARQDQADWDRFAELFGPILLDWLQQRLHLPPEDARDVCQEILLALIRALPKGLFDPTQGPFRAWLWRVAQNKAREFKRKQGRAPRLLGGEEAQRRLQEVPSAESAMTRQMEEEYRSHVVSRALLHIEPEFKPLTWQAFLETTREGRDPAEVAGRLGLTVNAVKIAKSRVLSRLRQEVMGLVDFDNQ